MYANKLREATIREFDVGGHQLGNDLSAVAADIKSIDTGPMIVQDKESTGR